MKTTVIITAGGLGKRMGQPKQFLKLLDKPMLEWTISAFKNCKSINEIILIIAKEDFEKAKDFCVKLAEGGNERTDSVRNGLKLVSPDTDIVLIHDGARPLVTCEVIEKVIEEAHKSGAVVVGVPVKDTIKQTTDHGPRSSEHSVEIVDKTLNRKLLWQAQTPQAFKYYIIKKAYENANSFATDDSKLVEDLGIPVHMVMGSYENIKVTTPEDIIIAEAILKHR